MLYMISYTIISSPLLFHATRRTKYHIKQLQRSLSNRQHQLEVGLMSSVLLPKLSNEFSQLGWIHSWKTKGVCVVCIHDKCSVMLCYQNNYVVNIYCIWSNYIKLYQPLPTFKELKMMSFWEDCPY